MAPAFHHPKEGNQKSVRVYQVYELTKVVILEVGREFQDSRGMWKEETQERGVPAAASSREHNEFDQICRLKKKVTLTISSVLLLFYPSFLFFDLKFPFRIK